MRTSRSTVACFVCGVGSWGLLGPTLCWGQATHWGHSASSFSFQHEARKLGSLPAASREDSILSPVPLPPHLPGPGIRGLPLGEGRASRQRRNLREHTE